MDDDEVIKDELRMALAGDEPARDRLVRRLTPVIQNRVARGLFRWRTGPASGRNIRQEVEDLTQEIFLVLFVDGGKVLRSWQPDRGLSLLNFVGLVAERRTASFLRNVKWSPWTEDPTLPEDFTQPSPERDLEEITASREESRLLLHRLKEELSPLGWHLFDLLFLQELTIEEVARQTGMTPGAIYQWRRRLRCRAVRQLGEVRKPPR